MVLVYFLQMDDFDVVCVVLVFESPLSFNHPITESKILIGSLMKC